MAMMKIIPPNRSLDQPQTQLIKISSNGLRGNDFKDFVKSAGWKTAELVKKIEKKAGDVLAHNIAMSATEIAGLNRNGDGFRESVLRDYHPTFVKYARAYRNHLNKDKEKSYGIIKHSDFNEDMKRVQLIIAYNGTKEAAARNGGLVADQEVEALNKQSDFPTSMACRVSHDVCLGCGNKAKTRVDYCTGEDEGGLCKRGGVRNRMCMVHNDGFINGVDNPEPTFFDLSKVARGADRTSFTLGLAKAASGYVMGGAELAESIGLSQPIYLYGVDNPYPSKIEKIAIELAAIELQYDNGLSTVYDLSLSPEFEKEASYKPEEDITLHQVYSALTMQKIALSPAKWLEFTHPDNRWCSSEMLSSGLQGIYGRMLMDGTIKEAGSSIPLLNSIVPSKLNTWAYKLAADLSFDKNYLKTRNYRASLNNYERPTPRSLSLIKSAGTAEYMARGYALYKLAFLNTLQDVNEDLELIKRLVVRQNYL